MPKIGNIYKPSAMSFEDEDRRIQVYQISCGRVLYTDLKTKENGECSLQDFDWYYIDILDRYIVRKRGQGMRYSESEMECESCKELNEVCEKLEVDMIYGNDSGYFHAMSDMVINYCPVCGRKLKVAKDNEEI